MKDLGSIIDLDFEVEAWTPAGRWKGLFGALIRERAIVSVWMKNGTPTCDAQSLAFGEAASELIAMGWEPIALSKDSVGSYAKRASAVGTVYPIVSDKEHAFSRALGAMVEKRLYGRTYLGASRSAYALNRAGVLLGRIETVDAKRHGAQLLELAKRLQADPAVHSG